MHRLSLFVVLALLAAACGRPFEPATPAGFVEVEDDQHDGRYEYRATSPDGLVLALRAVDNEKGGDLEFWVRAVSNQLRDQGGYALLETVEVKAVNASGKQLRFGLDQGSTPHLYYVSLFLKGDRVFVHEAGGTKELMTKHASEVAQSIQQLKLD